MDPVSHKDAYTEVIQKMSEYGLTHIGIVAYHPEDNNPDLRDIVVMMENVDKAKEAAEKLQGMTIGGLVANVHALEEKRFLTMRTMKGDERQRKRDAEEDARLVGLRDKICDKLEDHFPLGRGSMKIG